MSRTFCALDACVFEKASRKHGFSDHCMDVLPAFRRAEISQAQSYQAVRYHDVDARTS